MSITIDSLASNRSDVEYILAPQMALKVAAKHEKVLLVFDDMMLYKHKENYLCHLAGVPLAPINLANEIMERTGNFADGREVSSIIILEEGNQTLQLQHEEDAYTVHIESLVDQVIQFGNDQRRIRAVAPAMSFKIGQKYLN